MALLAGVAAGALITAPLIEMLYNAYGFAGHMPRPGMNPSTALAAPQASLMTALSSGIFNHRLPWTMVLIGMAVSLPLLAVEAWLRLRNRQFPVLTVGIGMYLPPSVVVTIAIGGVLGWLAEIRIRRLAVTGGLDPDQARARLRRRGVLLSSGFLVGESIAGIMLAALEAAGSHLPAIDLHSAATWLALAAFGVMLLLFYRSVSIEAPLSSAAGAD